jgi:hypothetical protein
MRKMIVRIGGTKIETVDGKAPINPFSQYPTNMAVMMIGPGVMKPSRINPGIIAAQANAGDLQGSGSWEEKIPALFQNLLNWFKVLPIWYKQRLIKPQKSATSPPLKKLSGRLAPLCRGGQKTRVRHEI